MANPTVWPLWKAALAAFVAMMIDDLVGTAMVVFESRFQWLPAGMCDVMGYIAGLACSLLAIDSILQNGIRNKRSIVLILVISVANFAGTIAGVDISRALTH